jgi:hypothetical protein
LITLWLRVVEVVLVMRQAVVEPVVSEQVRVSQ